MKKLVLVVVIFILLLPRGTSSQLPEINSTDGIQYFWRQNPSTFTIEDAHIYPLTTLQEPSFQNLGRAWITWTLNISGSLIPAYANFEKGNFGNYNTINVQYEEVRWFAVQDFLISIGVSNNNTDIHLILDNGQEIPRTIEGRTTDHEVFVSSGGEILVYAYNHGANRSTYYTPDFTQQGLVIESFVTNEKMIAGDLGAAVIRQADGNRVLYTGGTNYSIPDTLSNNLQIGQFQLSPVVFDLENNFVWFVNNNLIEFPENSDQIGYFGLGSSILFGENTMYELNPLGQWKTIGTFGAMPMDYSLVDIGLYLGPIPKSGLGLVMSGLDADGDKIPDTMEDYYGSLSTSTDTDNDGMSDQVEILSGTDPTKADATTDLDGDRMSNYEELEKNLDPKNADTDYGGALDGWEVKYNYDPSNPEDDLLDEDGDGVSNAAESLWNSDPRDTDTDDDGLPDQWEINSGIDPTIANANEDPDNDKRSNMVEYREGTDPLVPDPQPVFDGLHIESLIILAFTIPLGIFTWRRWN